MVTILKDEIIEKLICSECNGFLTVEPTKVYKNKIVKCGRCSSSNDLGTVSLLDTILQVALVPCQNKFEGCTELLAYGEVRAHEKICPKGIYSCPLATCNKFKESAYNLLKHFQFLHKDKILEGNLIYIKPNQLHAEVFLYKNNNYLFFVNASVQVQLDQVTIGAVHIGPKEQSKKMQQYFKIKNLENNSVVTSRKVICTNIEDKIQDFNIIIPLPWDEVSILVCEIFIESYDIPNIRWIEEKRKVKKRKVLSHFDILESHVVTENQRQFKLLDNYNMPVKFSLSFSECRTMVIIKKGISKRIYDLRCSGCKQFSTGFFLKGGKFVLSNKVLSCPCEKYLICVTCFKNAGFIQCRMGHIFSEQTDLGEIILDLQISCQWNCNSFFNFYNLYEHEISCSCMPFGPNGTCPIQECKEQVTDLAEHLKYCHNMKLYDNLNIRIFTLHFLQRENIKYIFNVLGYFFIGETNFFDKNICNIQLHLCDNSPVFPYSLVAVIVFLRNNKKRFEVCYADNMTIDVLELEDFFLTCV